MPAGRTPNVSVRVKLAPFPATGVSGVEVMEPSGPVIFAKIWPVGYLNKKASTSALVTETTKFPPSCVIANSGVTNVVGSNFGIIFVTSTHLFVVDFPLIVLHSSRCLFESNTCFFKRDLAQIAPAFWLVNLIVVAPDTCETNTRLKMVKAARKRLYIDPP